MRVFYGWVIAACAFCTLLVTNGLIITGINAFDASLLAEFGWSRGGLKFRDLLTFIAAGLLAPVGGALSDRFGVRRMMLTGAALLAVCLWAYSHIHSAAGMYAVHVLFAVVLVTCGLMVCVLLTSHWFVAARGTALGFVIIGTSLGGVVFPVLNTVVIAAYGWRTAMQLLIAAPLLLWVAIAALVRDSPADKGLQPYGAERAVPAAGTTRRQPERSVPYGEALRTTTFWALAVTAMSTFYAILATQAHLILYLRSLGASPVKAASGLSTLFVMGMIGKFLFGMLADLYDKQRVLQVNLLVMWIGGLALASMSPGAVWFAIALFGLGWGGIYTLLQVITMTAFGLAAGGKILGTITVLDAIGGGLGIWLTGLLYDRTGSYASAFAIVAGLITLAAGASTLVNVGLGADRRPAISET